MSPARHGSLSAETPRVLRSQDGLGINDMIVHYRSRERNMTAKLPTWPGFVPFPTFFLEKTENRARLNDLRVRAPYSAMGSDGHGPISFFFLEFV